MVDERWLTVAEIVDMLKVHENTVRRWLRSGKLPGRAFGGRMGYRVRESDLKKFLGGEQSEEPGQQEAA
jgi:excisionase family DNA binding protein